MNLTQNPAKGGLSMSDSLYKIGESYARYSLTDAAYEKIKIICQKKNQQVGLGWMYGFF